jgi:hypothetical protein
MRRVVIPLLLVALVAGPSWGDGFSAGPPDEFVINAQDGLVLSLSEEGGVRGLLVDGRELATGGEGGFSIREYTRRDEIKNLIEDPSFETGSGWSVYQQSDTGAFMEDTADPHSGAHSLRLSTVKDGDSVPDSIRLRSRAIPVTEGATYYLSAFVKTSVGVINDGWDDKRWTATPENGLNIGIDLTWLADGRLVSSEEAIVPVYVAQNWKELTQRVVAPAEADTVIVSCKLAGHVPQENLGDELSFWIDDISFYKELSSMKPVSLKGEISPSANGLRFIGTTGGDRPLSLTADFASLPSCLKISGELVDETGEERALDLLFTLPVDMVGGVWWDDVRNGHRIEEGKVYTYTVSADETGDLPINWYYISCVNDEEVGLALGVPPDSPRIFHGEYDATRRAFRIVFSLGLSPKTVKFPSRASFEIVLYRFSPQWGFRSAWERYMALYPEAFAVRSSYDKPIVTLGMVAPQGRRVADSEDFGMRFVQMHGLENERVARRVYEQATELGYKVAYYILPWAEETPCTDSASAPPDYPSIFDYQRRDWGKPGMQGDIAQAMADSFIEDTNGDIIISNVAIHNYDPHHWGAKLPLDIDPELPGGAGARFLDYVATACELADRFDGALVSIQMDNFFAESRFLDSDEEHFAYTDIPLSYSPNTFAPALPVSFTHVEFLRGLSEFLAENHPQTVMTPNGIGEGPAMFGYAFVATIPFEMGRVSFNGTEGEWNYRRTLAGPRPCLPVECRMEVLKEDQVEIEAFCDEDMHRSLAYGFYPGLNKLIGAAEGEQFTWLVEMLRPKYRQMTPILDELAVAGWQPVTYAREESAPEGFIIERFGGGEAKTIYFTIYNATCSERDFVLDIDAPSLGLSGEVSVQELMSKIESTKSVIDGHIQLTGVIPSKRTKVFRLH